MLGLCGLSLSLSTFVKRYACASQGMPGGVTVLLHKGVTSFMARGNASVLGTGKLHGEFSNGFAGFLRFLGYPFPIHRVIGFKQIIFETLPTYSSALCICLY